MRLHPGYETRPNDSNFIDVQKTPLHEGAIAYYLREAWKDMHGDYPSENTLAIVWSQVVLETGRDTDRVKNSMMRNYNYGNIKKNLDYSPNWTSYDAGEYLDGKHSMFYQYHPQTHFAAWKSPLEGALGYLNFLKTRKRYASAWVELGEGDAVGYVKELKAGGYFTAPLDYYTKVVVRLTNEFKGKYDKLMQWQPPTLPEPETAPETPPEPGPDPIIVAPRLAEIEPPEVIEDPPEPITDLVPEKTADSKLSVLAKVFFQVWEFILKALSYFKK
jgi:hypothetical protein